MEQWLIDQTSSIYLAARKIRDSCPAFRTEVGDARGSLARLHDDEFRMSSGPCMNGSINGQRTRFAEKVDTCA